MTLGLSLRLVSDGRAPPSKPKLEASPTQICLNSNSPTAALQGPGRAQPTPTARTAPPTPAPRLEQNKAARTRSQDAATLRSLKRQLRLHQSCDRSRQHQGPFWSDKNSKHGPKTSVVIVKTFGRDFRSKHVGHNAGTQTLSTFYHFAGKKSRT